MVNRLMKRIAHLAFLSGLIVLPMSLLAGDTTTTHHPSRHTRHVQEPASAQQHISHMQHSRRAAHVSTVSLTTSHGHATHASLSARRHRSGERFTGNSFADVDLTNGDII